jgi:hypothetical protein
MKTIKMNIDANGLAMRLATRKLTRDAMQFGDDDFYEDQKDGSVALTPRGQEIFNRYYDDYLETIESFKV